MQKPLAHHKYQFSGKFSLKGLMYGSLFGALAIGLLASLYALATYFVPFIYILFFFTIACGAGIGWMTARGLKAGHVRSRFVAILLGFLMGMGAAYFEWVIWLYLDEGRWIVSPVQVFYAVEALGTQGVWSLKQWTPTGNALYGIWVLEALVIAAVSAVVSMGALEDEVYCEHCGKWLNDSEQKHLSFNFPGEEVLESMMQGQWSAMKNLKSYENTQGEFSTPDPALGLVLKGCSSCENLHLLSLIQYTYSFDSDGDIQTREEKRIDQWLLSKAVYKEIAELYS